MPKISNYNFNNNRSQNESIIMQYYENIYRSKSSSISNEINESSIIKKQKHRRKTHKLHKQLSEYQTQKHITKPPETTATKAEKINVNAYWDMDD